jgi:heme-degrading monooxygenase HmoA
MGYNFFEATQEWPHAERQTSGKILVLSFWESEADMLASELTTLLCSIFVCSAHVV